jgi:FixJ family two-component response regulator
MVRDTVAKLLTRKGFSVLAFATGDDVLGHFRQAVHTEAYVVLTEYKLQGSMSGIETTIAIKKAYSAVCVILFTTDKFIQVPFTDIIDSVLFKPATSNELEEAIISTYVDKCLAYNECAFVN